MSMYNCSVCGAETCEHVISEIDTLKELSASNDRLP